MPGERLSLATSEQARLQAAGGEAFQSLAANQLACLAPNPAVYLALARELRQTGYFLVTLLANDERELTDNAFKLYAVFSHPAQDLLVTLLFSLGRGFTAYPSLRPLFAAAGPLEAEIRERFGLTASEPALPAPPAWAPETLYPLRRTTRSPDVAAALEPLRPAPPLGDAVRAPLPLGELELPVGPVHTGVIEPGHFRFEVAGERVERLELQLGFTHKGVERLFQTGPGLSEGWRLAERLVGDSACAHALAYCRALEALAGAVAPRPAELLRALALELERLSNHMADCAALAHAVAFDLPADGMAAAREKLLRLNHALTGHRLLRGLCRPGGATLPAPLKPEVVRAALDEAVSDFRPAARFLLSERRFRDRLVGVGVLTREQAEALGVTGLAARASGLERDFRRLHPGGAEALPEVASLLAEAAEPDDPQLSDERVTGDAFARYAQRVVEVDSSVRIVRRVLTLWDPAEAAVDFRSEVALKRAPNFHPGLGYAEGSRGPVVYWLMKDKFERVYRCKVCDPSCLNWPALRAAVEPHAGERGARSETLLADFPIINKSFGLSYSGNDL